MENNKKYEISEKKKNKLRMIIYSVDKEIIQTKIIPQRYELIM